MYFVYILECKDGSLYTGITNDLAKRLQRHRDGDGSRYTRAKGAKCYVYIEEQPSKGAALKREATLKRWPRKKKLALIRSVRQPRCARRTK